MSSAVQIIEPKGILDGTKAGDFRDNIDRSIKNGVQIILVDFTNVTFMDSSGLGTLVLSLKTVRNAGIKMFLCSINEQIKMLFELTSMDRVFEIFDNREEFEKILSSNAQ
ncbi:anti-anti-sigma factor [Xenococcus sp. PCC 7305]|uniref:STAS domain-containing protein n=1 Tax=Xenococcus sp. PCC 7305 TaxID=102125 RepID=UPI0002ABB034|nr:STAS domain-containing protein [Xenococcus sp. PCC 7305]ELS02043.1 anti-anti-sigma factor [Xenococcus sp. PCC 7305]